MWKRGGESAALDRARALLSAQRNRAGPGQSTTGSLAKLQDTMGVPVKNRSAAPLSSTVLSDLSDVSSLSSAPDKMISAAPEKNQKRDHISKEGPQSSLGRGSRFLKKAPLPASSQSPFRSGKIQHMTETYISPFQRSSQTAALNKLAQIESRFLSRKQPQEPLRQGSRLAHSQTSESGICPPPPQAVSQSWKTSVPVSAQSSSDQSPKGKCFLKNKATGAVDSTNAASSGSPKGPDASFRSWSRAASAVAPVSGIETMPVRATSNVCLESDEEDMRKLLGDSLDSTDNSFLGQKKISDKMLSKTSQRLPSTPSPSAPRSPASPSTRRSPFRFTGQPQGHFSPSAVCLSSSPPCMSPSLSQRLNSPHRAGSPQLSLSSRAGHSEVLSLEELFPVEPEEVPSAMSIASSEDFKINVLMLEDLAPATLGFTEAATEKQREEQRPHVSGSSHQELPKYKEKEKEQQQEEDILDYQSDFESECGTEPNYSGSQVSEHLLGDGDEEEVATELRDKTLDAGMSHERTADDYSSTFSDLRRCCSSRTSNYSEASESRSKRDSRSSGSPSSWTSSRRMGRHPTARRGLKEAAVQTQLDTVTHTWLSGLPTSALGLTHITSIPVAAHTLSAETVEALSSQNTALFVLHEMLRQQLSLTRHFIESSRHLHSSLVRSLEPPNYRYTKLEDTMEYIHKHRTPELRMEAMKKVQT